MQKDRLVYLMQQLQNAFVPERSEGMSGVFQCHIPGDEGGDWVMTLENGQCRIAPGTAGQPRATLTIEAGDLDDLLSGKLDPLRAFFTGKFQLSGDNHAAIKLLSMFDLNPRKFQ